MPPLERSPVIRPCPHGSCGAPEAAGGDWLPESWPLCSVRSLGNASDPLAPEFSPHMPIQDKSASLAELKELCVGQGQDRGGSGAENGCPTLACQAAGEPQAAVDPHKLQCGPVKGLEAAQHSGQSHDLSLGLTPFSPAVGRAEGLEPKRASPASLLPPCPNPAQVQELGFLKALCKHTDQQTPEA